MNNNKFKYLFKNVGILTLSNFASKILVFLLVPIYTRVLSTEDVGVYDLIVSTTSILFYVYTANIVSGVMRFTLDQDKSKSEIATIGLKFCVLSIVFYVLSVGTTSFFNLFPHISGLEIFIILFFVFYVLDNFLIQFAKGLEKISDMGIAAVLGTFAMILMNILLLLVFKMGLKGFFTANIIAYAVPTIFLFVRVQLWKYINISCYVNKSLQKEMLLYSLPLMASSIGWWVNSAFSKYVVTIICGVGTNGIFAVSHKIPQIINTLHGIFTEAWQISAVKEYNKENSSMFYGQIFIFTTTLMALACSIFIVLCRPLAQILYAYDFYVAWQYVPFILISCTFNSASGFLGTILSAKKQSKTMAIAAAYGSIVNVVLSIILVYIMGVQGAAITTAICSYVIYYVRKKAIFNEINSSGYRAIVLTWLLLCAQAVVEIYTQSYIIELSLMLFILAINQKNLTHSCKFIINGLKRK